MASPGRSVGFVHRSGPQFVVGSRPFFPIGTNSYYQMTYRRLRAAGPDEVLDKVAARGMTLVRTWAFQDAVEIGAGLQCAPARQLSPSERPIDFIDEQTLIALDQTLAGAASRGIRLILTLVNNWSDYGGIDRWTLWRFGAVCHDAFFSDAIIKRWFQDLAALLINRTNTVTGVAYRDDPAIFAWELANELRCSAQAAPGFDQWIGHMSAHIKSLDPYHLVTTGIEGFYGPAHAGRNTDAWMASCGQDFIANHQHASIDFATCHLWPQNWNWNPVRDTLSALSKARQYLQQRLTDAQSTLGKPLLCEEFGLPRDNMGRGLESGATRVRDLFFQQIASDLCEQCDEAGGACGGLLNWQILHDAYSQYDDGNGIFLPSDDRTDAIITSIAASLNRIMA